MKHLLKLITILSLLISVNAFAGDAYTDAEIKAAITSYNTKMTFIRKEFNERTNEKLLKDLKFAAAEISTAFANMGVYLDAARAFQILAKETAGTQAELARVTQELLSGNAVSTEGLPYTVPSFTAERAEDFCLPGEAADNAGYANKKLTKLIKLVEKRKKKAQRGRGGVSENSELIRVYNSYIQTLNELSGLVNDLRNGMSRRIADINANIRQVTGRNERIMKAVGTAARFFAIVRHHLKKIEVILIDSLKDPADTKQVLL